MRTICLVWLSCVLPLVALSQFSSEPYLASAKTPHVFYSAETRPFTIVRQLGPRLAVIRFNHDYVPGKDLFEYVLPASNTWKLSPLLLEATNQRAGSQLMVTVKDIRSFISACGSRLQVLEQYPATNTVAVQLKDDKSFEWLLASGQLVFADLRHRQAKEELIVSGFDAGANRINTAHHYFPQLHGQGLMVSIKENRFDTTDIDLKGRIAEGGFASVTVSGHATIMATMMAGAGNSYFEGKGAAWKASMQSASFANLMPEPDTYYRNQNISVQNHSYGTGIENYYGADAAAYDALVHANPTLVHVFSSGNSGLLAGTGPYAGITGFANLTGSFKMAKNIIVAGASDSLGNIEAASSRGPAYDGRVYPHVVAFGQDGSSGAAAIVSGISLLLQHGHKELHNDSLPAAALLKATLINTADEAGSPGPDYASGYGIANAYKAIASLRRNQFFTGSAQQGNAQTHNLNIPAGLQTLKYTLAWTDPAAQANAARALVNDLDIEVVHTQSGQRWHPWTLSRFPHRDSLLAPATRGRDTLNNVELVTIDAPPAGDYVITIRGSRVTGTQAYYVAYHADTANSFMWTYPMRNDPVLSGAPVLLRFSSVAPAFTTGSLEYSLNGSAWQPIAANVPVTGNSVRWHTPDTFATARLRMTIGGHAYSTDTFVLSKRTETYVGINCPDSVLIAWNRQAPAGNFRVYRRGGSFLEPVTVVSDTFFIAAKKDLNTSILTVAPLVNNREGIRAYAFDYNTQGVGCYFRSFLAQRTSDNKASLRLELGSLYRVSKIIVQKSTGGPFSDLQTIDPTVSLSYDFTDATLQQGVNRYVVALLRTDGRVAFSNTEVVYYTAGNPYIVYPNPVAAGGSFRILQPEPASLRVLLYDAMGRLIKDGTYNDVINIIPTAGLQRGMYVVVIKSEGKADARRKLVID